MWCHFTCTCHRWETLLSAAETETTQHSAHFPSWGRRCRRTREPRGVSLVTSTVPSRPKEDAATSRKGQQHNVISHHGTGALTTQAMQQCVLSPVTEKALSPIIKDSQHTVRTLLAQRSSCCQPRRPSVGRIPVILDSLLYAGTSICHRVAPTNIVSSLISSHYFHPLPV